MHYALTTWNAGTFPGQIAGLVKLQSVFFDGIYDLKEPHQKLSVVLRLIERLGLKLLQASSVGVIDHQVKREVEISV